jgi:PST family polysaccharide transporter
MWAAADFWTQQTGQLLTFILVGNILGPSVVGVMTMALLATQLFAMVLERGFPDAVIQRAELTDAHFDSAFWLMLALGTLSGIVLWALAPLLDSLFSEPQLSDIVPLMAIALPFVAVASCYKALLQRQLRFRQLAIRSILAYGSGFVAAVTLAWLSYGIYSLVAFFLVSRILDAVFIVVVSRLLPGLRITREALGHIIGYGKHRVGHMLAYYVGWQFDRFVIGIFFGPTVLGLYAIAGRLIAVMQNGVTGVIQRIAFPLLASQQTDRGSFDRTMREIMTFANLLSLPVFAGLALTSYGLIELLFTPKWLPAAPLMQILCIGGLAAASPTILGASTNALGRPDIVLRLTLILLALRVLGSFSAAPLGVSAVVGVRVGIDFVSLPLFFVLAKQLYQGKWLHLFGGSWVPALATAIMAAAVLMMSPVLTGLNVVLVLACQVLVGVAVYGIVVLLLAPDLYKKGIRAFRRKEAQPATPRVDAEQVGQS